MNTFPKAALSQHIAVLGKTGSGKSYAVRGIVEGLLDDNARVCIVDPTGAWNGLRSSATGKSAGYPVVIFGGNHADLPLSGTHGEAIAGIIGTSSTPAIIDTSLMRVGERTRFFADFADALVRKNKGPLQLVIDEAHLFAPQGKVNDPQSGAMLHAANNLVSLGRSRGLRIILITQRPAKLHKDSLTQVETLVAMRLIAPQDRRAVEDWIEDNADEKKGKEIIASLATLKTGQGWVWAPELGILDRITFPKIKTFDSGRAPDGSEAKGQVLAPIDREAIAQQLKTVAADALANDPAALKKRIAELEREAKTAPAQPAGDPKALDVAFQNGFSDGFGKGQRDIVDQLEVYYGSLEKWAEARPPPPVFRSLGNPSLWPKASKFPRIDLTSKPVSTPVKTPIKTGAKSNGSLPRAERALLTVLVQHPEGRTKIQLSILSGYSVRSSSFSNAIGALRSMGYATAGEPIRATDQGVAGLGDYDPLPTGPALIDYWLRNLPKAEQALLQACIEQYPRTLDKDQLAERSGYSITSSSFSNALGKLRSLELVSRGGDIKASEDLF